MRSLGDEYSQAMNIEMDALEAKEEALTKMRIQKEKVAKVYNKNVVPKEFLKNDKAGLEHVSARSNLQRSSIREMIP